MPLYSYALSFGAMLGIYALHQFSQLPAMQPVFAFSVFIGIFLCLALHILWRKKSRITRIKYLQDLKRRLCATWMMRRFNVREREKCLRLKHLHTIMLTACIFMMSLTCFFNYTLWRAHQRLDQRMPTVPLHQWHKQRIKIIDLSSQSPPDIGGASTKKIFHLYDNSDGGISKYVRIALLDHPKQLTMDMYWQGKSDFQPKPGEVYEVLLRIQPFHAYVNPHAFDAEFYAFSQNILYQARMKEVLNRHEVDFGDVMTRIHDLRYTLRERLQKFFQTYALPHLPLALGLVLGDTSGITPTQRQLFNTSGIAHLIAISGTHITMMAYIAGHLMLLFLRLYPRIFLRVPKIYWVDAAGLICAAFYSLLSGFSVPAQRTLLMLICARILPKHVRMDVILCWVLMIISIFDPWAIKTSGFILSFTAVALLIYLGRHQAYTAPGQKAWRSSLKNILKQQWYIGLTLIPVCIAIFGQFSVVSPVVNLVAIPWVTYIITPLLLLLSALVNFLPDTLWPYWAWPAGLVTEQINWLLMMCEKMVALPFAYAYLPTATRFELFWALIGIIILIGPSRWRMWGACFFLPFLLKKPSIAHGEFKMTALDIGQGSSIVIQTRGHSVVFDTGGQSPQQTIAEKTLKPFLWAEGLRVVDDLIISHEDLDHAGGIKVVLDNILIKHLHSSADSILHKKAAWTYGLQTYHNPQRASLCTPHVWEYDGVTFAMMYPFHITTQGQENADSCVLKVTNGRHSVLLTGDIEKAQEAELLRYYPPSFLQSSILLAPHHGSKTSSTPAFIDAVAPFAAIGQNGYLNRYKHPHPHILQRYMDRNIIYYRTDYDGAVIFDSQAAHLWTIRSLGGYWQFEHAANLASLE